MINSLPLDKVTQIFAALSDEDAHPYTILCETAVESILCRVKPSAEAQKWENRLCYVAACLAFYRYTLSRGCDNVSVYKAGDVNVQTRPDGARQSAQALLSDALKSVDGCLRHSGFCFKIV